MSSQIPKGGVIALYSQPIKLAPIQRVPTQTTFNFKPDKAEIETILNDMGMEFEPTHDPYQESIADDWYKWFGPLVVENESFIAGGVFKDKLSDKLPRDVDIFFYTEEAFLKRLVKFEANSLYKKKYTTTRSVGFEFDIGSEIITLDLVKTSYKQPKNVLKSFDFTICQCALYKENGVLKVLKHQMFDSHLNGKLLEVDIELFKYFHPNPQDLGFLFQRLVKYIGYGYKPSEKFNNWFFEQIRKVDSNIHVNFNKEPKY